MQRAAIMTAASIIAVIILSLSIFAHNDSGKKREGASTELEISPVEIKENIECKYYRKEDFANIKIHSPKLDAGIIRGCIVPHHLLAKDLIHEVFQNAMNSGGEYETVVLIGPDHESTDKGKVFTTVKDWQAPAGILKTDSNITKKLLKSSFIFENDEKLTTEHSTSSIIPFVKYYMKDVNVITLVLTKQVKAENINKLTEELCKYINTEKTLFVASVDFSHYLDLDTADSMDLISMSAIKNKDINKIMSFSNDNLDSPVSIVTMLKLMEKIGTDESTVLNRSNSEFILNTKIRETTSYITYLFR